MDKYLFIKQLQIQLRGLPSEEIAEVIDDYEDYFREAKASGLSEEAITQRLGNPYEIAKDIKTSYYNQPPQRDSNTSQIRNVIILIGLVFLNLTIVLGPVLGIIGSFFGLFVSGCVVVLSPLLVVVSILFGDGHLFELFISLIFAGLGLLLLPQLMKLGRAGAQLINRYIQWNVRLVKGGTL